MPKIYITQDTKVSSDYQIAKGKTVFIKNGSKLTVEGKRFRVNSTPTFFLNGKKLNLTSFSDLEKAVEQEINSL